MHKLSNTYKYIQITNTYKYIQIHTNYKYIQSLYLQISYKTCTNCHHLRKFVYLHFCVSIFVYLCICICVFVFVYLYLCICICVFVFVYLYLCICTSVITDSLQDMQKTYNHDIYCELFNCVLVVNFKSSKSPFSLV